ncbi:MAG TPA: hypothetical protein VGL47_02355 [Amycolatopsis sp.]
MTPEPLELEAMLRAEAPVRPVFLRRGVRLWLVTATTTCAPC